jgi:hypothetical protein
LRKPFTNKKAVVACQDLPPRQRFSSTISVYLPRSNADRNQDHLLRQINHVGLNRRL